MKKLILTFISIVTGLSVFAETWSIQGVSYTVTTTSTKTLGTSTTFKTAHLAGSDGDNLRIFYSITDLTNPNVAIKAVQGGSKLSTTATVGTMGNNINASTATTGITAIAGVNADFFTSSGPIGTTIKDGMAQKCFTGDGFSAIAIDQNNIPYIGKLTSHTCWLYNSSTSIEAYSTAAAINTTSENATNCGVGDQIIIYTPQYTLLESGNASAGGYAVQLKPVNNAQLVPGKYQTYEVVSTPSSGSVTIPSDGIVLFGKGTPGTFVSNCNVGDQITVYTRIQLTEYDGTVGLYTDNENNGIPQNGIQIHNAVGGSMMILCNGVTASSYTVTNGDISYDAPRTAVGYNADKTKLVMCVVDGRNSGYSNGCNGKQLADIMKSLGCSDALNFDGGGSSQFWNNVDGISNDANTNNSGNGIRYVNDALFIVEKEVATPTLSTSASSLSYTTTNNTATTQSITVTGSDLEGDITLALSGTNADQFSISASSIAQTAASDTITVTYAPTSTGSHTATLKVSSTNAASKTVTLNGSNTTTVALTEGWNHSANATGGIPSYLSNSNIRSIAYNDGKLYVLQSVANATPTISIINAYTGNNIGTLSVEGIESTLFPLSSLAVLDGKLLASNIANVTDTETQTLYVYKWDSDTAKPVKIVTDAIHDSEITGATMSVSGNLTNGRLWFTNQGTSKVLYYAITNGTVSQTATVINLTSGTSTFNGGDGRGSASIVYNSDGTFWLDSKDNVPALFSAEGVLQKQMNSSIVSKYGTALNLFDFGGKSYAAATTYLTSTVDGTTNAMGNGALALIDVTSGMDAATSYELLIPAAGLGTANNAQRVSSICQSTHDSDNALDLWVCVQGQGVAYYTTSIPEITIPALSAGDVSTVSLNAVDNSTSDKSLTISGTNLEGDITLALSGDNADQFSISASSIAQAAASGTITVTYNPTEVAAHTATLSISSPNATTVNVALSAENKNSSDLNTVSEGYKFSQNWVKTGGHLVAEAQSRWATAHDGKIYVNDHANSKLYYWTESGLTDTGLSSTPGTALASDDAGNIILSTTQWSAAATSYKVLPAGGNAFQDLSVTLPEGISAASMIFMGDAIGDIMSSTGGAIYVIPNNATSVAKIIIANGEQVSATKIDVGITADARTIALPLTSDITSDDIAVRNRDLKHFYHSNGTEFVAYDNNGITTTQGGTLFTLDNTLYAVEPIGKSYCDGFQIVNIDENTVVASHSAIWDTAASAPNANVIIAEPTSSTEIKLYQYVPGQVAAMYSFSIDKATGIDEIGVEANTPVEYYNLQGIKVNAENLKNGIYIKKQGNKTTKVVCK